MTIFSYARLCAADKEAVLRNHALFLEYYNDGGSIVCVYFFNGFFIEVTIRDEKVISNIPYQRGYKINKIMCVTDKQSISFNQPQRSLSVSIPARLVTRVRRTRKNNR